MFSWRAAGPTHLLNGPSGDVAADVNVSTTPNQPPNERDGLRGRVRAAPRRFGMAQPKSLWDWGNHGMSLSSGL